jgi:hypothetical protein
MRDQLLALLVVIGAALLGWMVLHDRRGKRRGRASGPEGWAGGDGDGGGWFDGHGHSGDQGGSSGAGGSDGGGGGGDGGAEAMAVEVEAGTKESCAPNEGRLIFLNAAF